MTGDKDHKKLEARQLKKTKKAPSRQLKVESTTWEKKMKRRDQLKRIRALSKQLRDQINEETQRAQQARKANMERKKENERKSMVVQEIKNVKAIKKLSPKHRRAARIFMLHELNK